MIIKLHHYPGNPAPFPRAVPLEDNKEDISPSRFSMRCSKLVFAALLVLLFSAVAVGQQIRGDYIETRSADVYTGQSFANGEVNLVGNEAILAWHIQAGSWDGIALEGLTVAAAVKAHGTLGDPYENPLPAHAVLMMDERATPAQRTALIAFAQKMAGELLRNIENVVPMPMELAVSPEHHGRALFRAGEFATVQTRPINGMDHVCGNEITYYPPLTPLSHAMAAVAVTDSYRGPGLGVDWESHGKRSAFVGTFAR
jgi:hypothetical protein